MLHDSGTPLANAVVGILMSLVRLLGFTTLSCGCVSGRYREVSTDREITYIEEKGVSCSQSGHRRNQPIGPDRVAHGFGAGIATSAELAWSQALHASALSPCPSSLSPSADSPVLLCR